MKTLLGVFSASEYCLRVDLLGSYNSNNSCPIRLKFAGLFVLTQFDIQKRCWRFSVVGQFLILYNALSKFPVKNTIFNFKNLINAERNI